MLFSFPPCPVCGGEQALFKRQAGPLLTIGFFESVRLHALVCLKCGHATEHIHPNDMPLLRAIVEKRGPLPD